VAVLRVSLVGVSVVTIGWATITDPRLLIANELFATLCWSGAETAILVLLFTCHEDQAQRPRLVGYYHLLGGVAVVLSSLVGTWLVGLLPPFQGSVFRSLFLAGLCIRIPVALAAWWVLARHANTRMESATPPQAGKSRNG
jgi:MFS family permease